MESRRSKVTTGRNRRVSRRLPEVTSVITLLWKDMSPGMSPQLKQNDVQEPLQEALEAAENTNTKYYIRQALQLTELDS